MPVVDVPMPGKILELEVSPHGPLKLKHQRDSTEVVLVCGPSVSPEDGLNLFGGSRLLHPRVATRDSANSYSCVHAFAALSKAPHG